MEKLFVYADFDWLDTPTLIGELSFDSVRGNETYGFSFDKDWLAKYGDVFFGEDLQNFPGVQYARSGQDIFGCFSDALPDRWGRTLLNRREQIAATEEKRAVRRLSSFDYLVRIDDASRMGGFRFARSKGGEFINADESLRVPLASVPNSCVQPTRLRRARRKISCRKRNGCCSYFIPAHRSAVLVRRLLS